MPEREPEESVAASVLSSLLDFIYPPVCQVCDSTFSGDNIWLCDSCRDRLEIYACAVCPVCRAALEDSERRCHNCRQRANLDWIYSLGPYDERFAHLIKAVKYGPRPGLGKLLGSMLAERLSTLLQFESVSAVCPIPLHPRKLRRRGFNQSAIIAETVADLLHLGYLPDELIQTKSNSDQIGLSVPERFANVFGVYEVAGDSRLKDQSVLLIDDVTTTGATLNAAAIALRQGGAGSVAAATIAAATDEGVDYDTALRFMLQEEG